MITLLEYGILILKGVLKQFRNLVMSYAYFNSTLIYYYVQQIIIELLWNINNSNHPLNSFEGQLLWINCLVKCSEDYFAS